MTNAAKTEIITKISAKTCKAVPELEIVTVDGKQVPRAKGEQHLLRIIGMTNGTKVINTEYGASTAFLGTFEATNVKTGEIFRSSKCFLPESATGMLSVAVDTSNGPVEFAVDIGAKPSATPTGYEYTVKPLTAPSESDPLEMLKMKLVASFPALPSPVAAPVENKTEEKKDVETATVSESREKGKKK